MKNNDNKEYYIKLKDKEVLLKIKSYRNSRHIKAYFKGETLILSKPTRCSGKEALKLIKEYEEKLYSQYIKITSTENPHVKHWHTGERIAILGEDYTIIRQSEKGKYIKIHIDKEQKNLVVILPNDIEEQDVKANVDKGIKQLLKKETTEILEEKLLYWSKITNIEYSSFKVQDATSKFGSCVPKTKALHFTSRLIMLPEDKIDAIVVHELCHIIHKNHSKEFYDLVKKYIPNYDDINKWLKKNNNIITI